MASYVNQSYLATTQSVNWSTSVASYCNGVSTVRFAYQFCLENMVPWRIQTPVVGPDAMPECSPRKVQVLNCTASFKTGRELKLLLLWGRRWSRGCEE